MRDKLDQSIDNARYIFAAIAISSFILAGLLIAFHFGWLK